MRQIIFLAVILGILATGCQKDENENPSVDFNTLKQEALNDFTHKVAVQGYKDLDEAASAFSDAITALNNDATEENLTMAKNGWKNMRSIWEQCEGFLFGPVEDNDYDPNMDTWPTDYAQMDSLLASANPLELSDVQQLTLSLRGYHPLEYILFGDHGNRTAASLTARQKKYMTSLATDLKNTCHELYTSWTQAPVLFMNEVLTAGSGSAKYARKQEVFLAIAGGMTDICEEVGAGKMKEPFDNYQTNGAELVESPYSGNSVTDFKNNIIGLQNVYLGRYQEDGRGLDELVAAKNKALDNKIKAQITEAIHSFDNITVPYEEAITTQRVQVQQTMDKLATLQETLEQELKPFIIQYITD